MKKKGLILGGLLWAFAVSLCLAGDKVPGDLSVIYDFVQGGPEKGATHETYKVSGSTLVQETDYIPTEFGSNVSKRRKESKTYKVSKDQLSDLWGIISNNTFLDWPAVSPQRPPMSGNQTFTIKANGKTVTHSMWEQGNRDRFIEFSREFINWTKRVMTVEF